MPEANVEREFALESDQSTGFQILRAIRRIIRKTSDYSRAVGKHGGLSVPQMLCLKALADFPPEAEVTVVMLSSTVQLSAPTVSRILDKLEKSGYVIRERRSQDRRRVCISLTEQGWQRIDKLPTPLDEQFLSKLASLERSEVAQLRNALEKIVELMDAGDIDAAPMLTLEVDAVASGTRLPPTEPERLAQAKSADQTSSPSTSPSPSPKDFEPSQSLGHRGRQL